MHGVMLVAQALGADGAWWAKMRGSINESYTKTDEVTNPAAFFLGHLRQDVDILKELLDKNDDEVVATISSLNIFHIGGRGEDPYPFPCEKKAESLHCERRRVRSESEGDREA